MTERKKILDNTPPAGVLVRGNRALFEKYCRAEGVDPDKTVTSPILAKLIAEQNERRRIDAPEE